MMSNLQKVGLRFERLLVLSAPVTLACILVAFISVATDASQDKKAASCYEMAAGLVQKHLPELETAWKKRQMIGKTMFATDYTIELLHLAAQDLPYSCDWKIFNQESSKATPPSDFAKQLAEAAKKIRSDSEKKPIRSFGVEMPDRAAINFFGTNIIIRTVTLAQMAQVVLFPVLLLWMGSLFNTRYRETLLIERAVKIEELYPHCMNLYLNADLPGPRRYSPLFKMMRSAIIVFPSFIRVAMFSIFIVPPTLFYCASLYYLAGDEYPILSILSGVLTFCFVFVNLVSEFNIWHVSKTFPGPRILQQSR